MDEYLSIEGYKDIYAIGDCCNTKDTKLAYTAGEQAKLVLKNLFNRKNGKSQERWKGEWNNIVEQLLPTNQFVDAVPYLVLYSITCVTEKLNPTEYSADIWWKWNLT